MDKTFTARLKGHALAWGFNEVTSGNITWEQFENWFLGVSLVAPEYLADAKTINDVDYWMNVTFTQQSLPSFATFENNFPKRSVKTVLDLATDLGGEIGDFIK